MDKEIYIYHKDWNEKCKLKENYIYRKENSSERGIFKNINNNEILIEWENWEKENFIIINNIYIEKEYFKKIKKYNLLEKEKNNILLFDLKKNKFILNEFNNIYIENDNINYNNFNYSFFSNDIYILESDINYFFNIDTINFNKKNKFILNKYNNEFFDFKNINNSGTYVTENNILYLKWNDGTEKKYLSNIYYEDNKINYENIKIIKPNNFIITNKILFSNISLIKNKIYLTSIYYKDSPWDIEKIDFKLNYNIIKKDILKYDNYESCLIIILEIEKNIDELKIIINYEENSKSFNLKQLKLPENNIYSMTLFKDDYNLLKKYLEYYSNLGVSCFLLYYNNLIDDDFIQEINIINQSKYQIILVEWNYDYWYKYNNNNKHHHAQTMAINDSLYILKNFCNYVLYNDLDEYIKIDKTFNDIIKEDEKVDIYEFKCLFCKMGENLIKYRNFYFEYDENKIIKGNYWDKYREKNLIKIKNINLMGIHNAVNEFNKDILNKKHISYFYHFINFYEKNREELMTKYIS